SGASTHESKVPEKRSRDREQKKADCHPSGRRSAGGPELQEEAERESRIYGSRIPRSHSAHLCLRDYLYGLYTAVSEMVVLVGIFTISKSVDPSFAQWLNASLP